MSKILCISGYGRSGNTILGMALGELSFAANLGEIRRIFCPEDLGKALSGSGLPYAECPFWGPVLAELNIDPASPPKCFHQIWKYDHFVTKTMERKDLKLADLEQLIEENPLLNEQLDWISRIFITLANHSDKEYIIDSSIVPFWPIFLKRADIKDIRIIHIIRDVRGVCFSRMKQVNRPDKKGYEMEILPPSISVQRWKRHNNCTLYLKKLFHHYHFLRYEDLVNNPSRTLLNIMQNLELPREETSRFIDNRKIHFQPNVTFFGNPSRMRTGAIELKPDEKWKSELPLNDRMKISLKCLADFRKYGYPIW